MDAVHYSDIYTHYIAEYDGEWEKIRAYSCFRCYIDWIPELPETHKFDLEREKITVTDNGTLIKPFGPGYGYSIYMFDESHYKYPMKAENAEEIHD